MAKLMTARYAGQCTMCTAGVKAGDAILYGGRGNTRHTDCTRPTGTAQHVCNVTCNHADTSGVNTQTVDYAPGINPEEPASNGYVPDGYVPVRPTRRNGYRTYSARTAYTSTGARMTDRSSRCEDAPCCGCCD